MCEEESVRKERLASYRFVAGDWAALFVVWLGVDFFAAMTLRNRMAELRPMPVGGSAIIRNLAQVECLALSSDFWGPLFPQARRVRLPDGVVVARARCIGLGPGNRSKESTVRVTRIN